MVCALQRRFDNGRYGDWQNGRAARATRILVDPRRWRLHKVTHRCHRHIPVGHRSTDLVPTPRRTDQIARRHQIVEPEALIADTLHGVIDCIIRDRIIADAIATEELATSQP